MNQNLITIKELSEYLPDHPVVPTIYTWVCRGKIPFQKKGKKLFFDKNIIDKWDEDGRPEIKK